MNGWIKLHRSLLEWEWYSKPVVRSIFIHCLLRANHKDNKWRGKLVSRGEFISSLGKLAEETGFSVQQVRTAIKHLKSTQELTCSGSAQHTVFKVNNYDKYQDLTSEATNEQQAINKQSTTNKNDKNEKKETIPYQQIADIYNEAIDKPFSKILEVTDKRKPLIRKFYGAMGKDLGKVQAYFEYFNKNAPQWMRGSNGYKPLRFEKIIDVNLVVQFREGVHDE